MEPAGWDRPVTAAAAAAIAAKGRLRMCMHRVRVRCRRRGRRPRRGLRLLLQCTRVRMGRVAETIALGTAGASR